MYTKFKKISIQKELSEKFEKDQEERLLVNYRYIYRERKKSKVGMFHYYFTNCKCVNDFISSLEYGACTEIQLTKKQKEILNFKAICYNHINKYDINSLIEIYLSTLYSGIDDWGTAYKSLKSNKLYFRYQLKELNHEKINEYYLEEKIKILEKKINPEKLSHFIVNVKNKKIYHNISNIYNKLLNSKIKFVNTISIEQIISLSKVSLFHKETINKEGFLEFYESKEFQVYKELMWACYEITRDVGYSTFERNVIIELIVNYMEENRFV